MGYKIEEKLLPVNKYTRPGKKITTKGVVIHWTANMGKGANAMAHYRYFSQATVTASAHYFVDDKQILRIIPENEMAYHVGAKSYKTNYFGSYPNNCLVGVEMCVNPDGDFNKTYWASVWLCADILYRHKLNPDKDLVRHYDITGKDCPRMFVDDASAKQFLGTNAYGAWTTFKADVKKAYQLMVNPVPSKPTVEEVIKTMSKYFEDVPEGSWSGSTIDRAKELGLMDGVSSKKFDPKGVVTREMLAAVAVRVHDKLNK